MNIVLPSVPSIIGKRFSESTNAPGHLLHSSRIATGVSLCEEIAFSDVNQSPS